MLRVKQTRFRAYCWFGMVLFFRGAERWKLEGEMTRVMKCPRVQTATSVDLSRAVLEGGESGVSDGQGKWRQADRLTVCKAVLEHPQGQVRVCEDMG